MTLTLTKEQAAGLETRMAQSRVVMTSAAGFFLWALVIGKASH